MNTERIYYSHDAEVHELRVRSVIMFFCLTFGLGIGISLALLFAPNTGKKNRQELVQTVKDGLQTGRDNFEPVAKRIEKEFADAKKNVEEHLKQA